MTLNYRNSQLLQFDHMCDELFLWHFHGDTLGINLPNSSDITRDKKKAVIFNKPVTKKYQVVFDKRVVCDDFTTLPYGY